MITVFSPSFGFFPLSRDFALALIRQRVIKRIPCFEAKKRSLWYIVLKKLTGVLSWKKS